MLITGVLQNKIVFIFMRGVLRNWRRSFGNHWQAQNNGCAWDPRPITTSMWPTQPPLNRETANNTFFKAAWPMQCSLSFLVDGFQFRMDGDKHSAWKKMPRSNFSITFVEWGTLSCALKRVDSRSRSSCVCSIWSYLCCASVSIGNGRFRFNAFAQQLTSSWSN